MTERDWNSCTVPDKILGWLDTLGGLSQRKLRLFCVAACRRIWHLLPNGRCRQAVECAERFADGLVQEEELDDVCGLAWEAVDELHGGPRVAEHASRAVAWAAQVPDAWGGLAQAAEAAAGDAERAAAEEG